MNALQTIRRNQTRRANARARSAFFRKTGAWVGVVALAAVCLPMAGAVGWLVAAGVGA